MFKLNDLILIDDRVCKILEINRSKPGKHGEAKARIVASEIFGSTEAKRNIVKPVKHKEKHPIIQRRQGTVCGADPERKLLEVIDMETYETVNVEYDPETIKIGGETTQLLTFLEWGSFRKALAIRSANE